MSITDELREWASGAKPAVVDGCSISVGTMTYGCKKALLAIADRIDAEHQKCIDAMWEDAKSHLSDESLTEQGWIRLPKDADGEYIHVGDVLDGYGKTIEAVELRIGRSGWVIISRDGNGYADTFAFTHHHAPTVEDVLRDVVTLCHNTWKEESPFHFYDVDDVMKSGNIAEYASRLRLAGDAE